MSPAERDHKYTAFETSDEAILNDLPSYASALVTIKLKETGTLIGPGGVGNVKLNRAQRHVHDLIEQQLHDQGFVRCIILKGRQLGISTYVSMRFYKGAATKSGKRCYILTHEDKATQNLFAMAKRIHKYMPRDYKPWASSNNIYELDFANLESGYRVGTAGGTGGGGRSQTIQLFHGSEAAWWQNADEHYAGVVQGVPQAPHTEIIMESTANGIGGKFYDEWQLASKGESLYIPIFCPWFWGDEYSMSAQDGPRYRPSEDELEYQEAYDLDDDQMRWAHFTNIELSGEPGIFGWKFMQEYPANAVEAFQTSGDESFIKPQYVMRARHNTAIDQSYAPMLLGVDVARGGKAKSCIYSRQGRKAGQYVKLLDVDDHVVLANAVARAINETGAKMTFIDVTGMGSGTYDVLKDLGFKKKIRGINFGERADDKDLYVNKRSEIWTRMRDWLKDPGGADIPDDDEIHKQLCGPSTGPANYDANSRFKMEEKKAVLDRIKTNLDESDSLALTFSSTVIVPTEEEVEEAEWEKKIARKRRKKSWMSG